MLITANQSLQYVTLFYDDYVAILLTTEYIGIDLVHRTKYHTGQSDHGLSSDGVAVRCGISTYPNKDHTKYRTLIKNKFLK